MSPDLGSYDVIVINSSAGKDSQCMLDVVVEQADAANFSRGRIVVVHAHLEGSEWEGVEELAREQAAHYGLRFEIVSRSQGILEHAEARGMWPSPTSRWCTSDHKRDQVSKLLTRLRNEFLEKRQMRVLSCLGMRAQESPARAKLQPLSQDRRNSNGRRHVDTWLPLHAWTADQVWGRIKASGVRHHWAYDKGLPRLSCVFCIFAPKAALLLAGKLNPEMLQKHVDAERRMGHRFRMDVSLEEIQQEIAAGAVIGEIKDWTM